MSSGALRGIGGMSRVRFVELYLEHGRREGVWVAPTYDDASFSIVDAGRVHNLSAVYERFLGLPVRSRDYFLTRAVRSHTLSAVRNVREFAHARERMFPRLRSGAYLDLVTLDAHNRGRVVQPMHEHWAGELHVTVVIDDGDAMTTVTHEMLAAWALPFAEVKRVALANLAPLSAEPLGQLAPGFWMGPWDDAYAASRALLVDASALCAKPVVALPNRDTMLVADGADPAALERLVSFLEGVADRDYPLSRSIFAAQHGTLGEWMLPETHAAAARHRRACVAARVERYSEQQWILQEAVGDDCYVASAELDETRDGEVTSRALWTEGVDALLPEVDRLHLLSAAADGTSSRLVVAPLSAVRALPGVLEPTERLLPRFRTRRFPSAHEISQIAVPVVQDPTTASVSEPGWRP